MRDADRVHETRPQNNFGIQKIARRSIEAIAPADASKGLSEKSSKVTSSSREHSSFPQDCNSNVPDETLTHHFFALYWGIRVSSRHHPWLLFTAVTYKNSRYTCTESGRNGLPQRIGSEPATSRRLESQQSFREFCWPRSHLFRGEVGALKNDIRSSIVPLRQPY